MDRNDDTTIQKTVRGWLARSTRYGVAAEGDSENVALTKLHKLVETMDKLTAKREAAAREQRGA